MLRMVRIAFVIWFATGSFALAETIKFSESELEKESVLPVFDIQAKVLDRNIVSSGRFEVGVFGGSSLIEPIFNQLTYGFYGTYHLNDIHGVHVMTLSWAEGLTDNAKQMNATTGLDFSYAPGPKTLTLVEWEYTAWYGKISLSKETVMNTMFYGLAGLGMIAYDGLGSVAISGGIGEKFYFGKNLSLRMDLFLLNHNAPDPLSADVTVPQDASAFKQANYFSTLLTLGLVWLI